jgi:uncharacterized protein (DUF983 family)
MSDVTSVYTPGSDTPAPSLMTSLKRGLARRCPRCGKGRLFTSYLKVSPACERCGEPFGHIRADDAPPYFTIAIVGHIVVPGLLAMEKYLAPPLWLQFSIWLPVTLALTVALLPYVKGAVVGAMWSLKPGE